MSLLKTNKALLTSLVLVIALTSTSVTAHGGGSEGSETALPPPPSVYATDKSTFASGNIALGFGLTALAAFCSALGSFTPLLDLIFPYIPWLKDFRITQSKGFLAGSLSFSAGILLFLTLGDLYPEAISSFRTSKLFDPKYADIVAASIFIATILIIMTFKYFFGHYHHHHHHNLHKNTEVDSELIDQKKVDVEEDKTTVVKTDDSQKLKSLGIQIAVALAIHNFPEGLSAFAAAIANAKIGVIYAIALSLHKIPEGLIISLPIYYATGSRWKAFIIAAAVGVTSQMLGAVLGYIIFVTVWNEAVSGFLFAIVTGALLYVILHGMIPLARSYDPQDKYYTYCVCSGLFFFAIVASLFNL
ncbi:ZIP zinc transporter-domain-containing protein [Gigaspora rosea]|uniref:ZIP zinc transporter-domain-containing protein n=1 Tax=Gigaspora rosea TaxID=44941 RepID=A0A397VFV7_9GLOM|nr:ZIP zinc transporter-domain-containing protein [Gigaspora rosea]